MVRLALTTAVAALVAVASAQLQVVAPSSKIWWVAKSQNVIKWTCDKSQYSNFTVLIVNSDKNVLSGPLAFIAIQPNADCSKLVTQQQADQNAGTGYRIQLANPFNNTDVYAESEPFEIKPLGATYPEQEAPPTNVSGNATTNSSNSNSNGSESLSFSRLGFSAGFGLAAIGTVLGLLA